MIVFNIMKYYLTLFITGMILLLSSCATKSDIDNLQHQIDGLKSGQIATIENQINSINGSITSLQETDREIKGYITALQNTASELQKSINSADGKIDDLEKALALVNSAIENLKAKDSALEQRISDLKDYVDTQLRGAKDWVSATFATLEQYNGIVSEIGGIKGSISSINTAIEQMESRLNGKITLMKGEIEEAYTKAIGSLESSLKNWVNEQLEGYWTIAETEGKLETLEGNLTQEDESIRGDIGKLRASLDSAKTELTEGYKAAIKKAIDENNGVLDGKLYEAVSGLNTRIDGEVSTINERIGKLEKRVLDLESAVSELLSRIQSLSYIPRYTDGASTMWLKIKSDGNVETRDTLEFRVSPADCADSLVKVWDKAISAEAVSLLTRGAQETVSLQVVSVTGGNGKLSVVLDGSVLGEKFYSGEQQMKAVVIISDGNNERTSEYITMVAKDDPTIPNNIILYTSSDGKTIDPYNTSTDAFGAIIFSNKYESGKGIIVFDGDVTSIGNSAFSYCKRLTSILIPSSVTSIGERAFMGCGRLAAVHIPKSVTHIDDWDQPFSQCWRLASITVDPDNSIYDSRDACNAIIETKSNTLIAGCINTIIPNTITTIISYAFLEIGITSLNIPSSVTCIGEGAFGWCHNLTSITVDPGNTVYDSRDNCKAIIETKSNTLITGCINTVIPNTVTSIGGAAFCNCRGLTTIEIPNSVTSISQSAFSGCTELSSIIVAPDNPVYDSRNNCNAIIETQTNYLFLGFKTTIIPDTVIGIWDSAFENCTLLNKIEIPNSVTFIGEKAFQNCTGLTTIELSNSLSLIGELAFRGCTGLTSIEIPNSVQYIGGLAFLNCRGLTDIVIPGSVQHLGAGAFQNCTGLTSIHCLATIPPDNPSIPFYGNYYNVCGYGVSDFDMFKNTNDCPIYVPAESVDAYKSEWSLFADRIKAIQ